MTTPLRTYRAAVVLLTAALVATLTVALTGGQRADAVDGPVEVVYVATGQNFPDALAGANLAATVGAPMLTVNPDLPIPDATITALLALDPNQIIILGGPVAVSDAVKGALADYARSGAVTRIEGGDRHDTAAKIADALPDKVHDADQLDGLDSTDFLRSNATAANSSKLGGLELAAVSTIHGERDRTLEWQAAPSPGAAHSTEFTAPTDGYVFVSASVAVANRDTDPDTATTLLLLDWDGALTESSIFAAALGGTDVALEGSGGAQAVGTSSMSAAVPVSAGPHTLEMFFTNTVNMEYAGSSISVIFAPSGSATPPGILEP